MSKQPQLSVMPDGKDAVKVKTGTTLAKGQFSEAKYDIKKGTRILTDPPVLKTDRAVNQCDLYVQFQKLNSDTRERILELSTRPGLPQKFVQRIHKNDLGQLYNQCEEKKSDSTTKRNIADAGKVLAVFEDNQVQLQYESRPGLALRIAKINHSCVPNVAVAWNESLQAYTVHAIRDIRKGEEILYSYTYLPEPIDDRRVRLERWGFVCKCPACDYPYATDQELRAKFLKDEQKSRPEARRINTGELNRLLYDGDTLQHKDNRRREWRRFSMGLNRVAGMNLNDTSTYKSMLEKLESEKSLLEEKARLYWYLALEYDKDDENHDSDAVECAKACSNALSLARTCYGDDHQFTQTIRKFVIKECEMSKTFLQAFESK